MSYRGGNSQQFLAVQIFERCPDFHFISNRKSEQVVQKYVFTFSFFFKTQIWPSRFLERCSHFRFWWKSKCEHLSCPNLYRKGVHISIFIKNANVNTFSKIWTARFVIWRNWKCEHLSKNLDGQICVFNENENQDTFQKSERPEIVENFHLWNQKWSDADRSATTVRLALRC